MSDPVPDIPRDLVCRARRGDEAALERLVEAAYPLVRRWSLVHTGDEAEADDLTQDVLIRMIRRLSSFRGDSRFWTWLYAVTRNAARHRFRARGRRERADHDPRTHVQLVADGPVDPATSAERHDLRHVLDVFFRQLPERQREVFDLVELQGLSASEAAELLGIEPVSVRASLFKARRRMRARILEMRPEIVEDAR